MQTSRRKKSLWIFLAVNLIGIAVALILQSGLGCDPIGLLCDGISHALSIRFGIASFLYNVAVIGVALLIAKKNLGMGTVIYGLMSGFFIDFYMMIFDRMGMAHRGIVVSAVAFMIGEACMSLAFAILMQLKLGMTALDAVLVTIEKHIRIPYAYVKISMDILLVISGTLLGGVFGIGTIISAMVTGLLVARFGRLIEHLQYTYGNRSVQKQTAHGSYAANEE